MQQPYPILTYDSTTKQFRVIVEGQAIHVEGPDDGIKTLIASYWTFNLQFKESCKKFLSFMSRPVYGNSGVKISHSIARVTASF